MNDRILGIAALLLAAFLAWFGQDLDPPFAYEPVGPKAFPHILAFIIALCGLRLTWRGGNPAEANTSQANLRILALVAILAVYALAFQWLGFIIATALMACLVGRLFGGSWGKCLLGGCVMGLGFFLLFDKVLDVVLPTGLLGALI